MALTRRFWIWCVCLTVCVVCSFVCWFDGWQDIMGVGDVQRLKSADAKIHIFYEVAGVLWW